jgi:hypothetical protein|tara:strand:- start:83 stop:325 length:243 start_codon:yes stop_codon:yes gene_type:complete
MKILTVEKVEIEFEKQEDKDRISNWCTYIRVQVKNHQKILLMIKTDEQPFTKVTVCKENVVDTLPGFAALLKNYDGFEVK